MSDTNVNSIHNATMNFMFNGQTKYMPNANDVVKWAKDTILEAIDFHAENLTDSHSMVKIPELTLDLKLQFEDGFFMDSQRVRAIIGDQIYSSLKTAIREKKTLQVPLRQHKASIVLLYLKTGQLTVSYTPTDWQQLITEFFIALLEDEVIRKKWLAIIKDRNVFSRFYSLRKLKDITVVLTEITADHETEQKLSAVWTFIRHNREHFSFIKQLDFYYTIFQRLSVNKPSLTTVLRSTLETGLIQKNLNHQKLEIPKEVPIPMDIKQLLSVIYEKEDVTKQEIPLEHQPKDKETYEEQPKILEEGTFIHQAGLALLTPFLPDFFKNLGYIGAQGQLLKKQKIPMLLHFLVTGETTASERQLVLPKILAGLDPEERCDTKIRKTKNLTKETLALLSSVIEHWEVLKSTSPEGLRETFLIREGTLKIKNGFYYLSVNEKSVDILLSYVPWNYGTIKLSWMKNILFVKWSKS